MKTKSLFALQVMVSTFTTFYVAQLSTAFAQGTAFTYQGRLNDGASPATGIYDLRFTIFDLSGGGSVVGGPLTNAPTSVTNGLFTVTLDFGAGVFNGADRWLEIAVRTNGASVFTNLSSRQKITATPYAIYSAGATTASTATTASSANSVAAANISGTLALAQLPGAVVTNNQSGVNLNGTFAGNGGGLSGVKLTSLASFGAIHGGDFFPSFSITVGTNPKTVVAGDINGDGWADLVACNESSSTLSVLTNDGTGNFSTAATISPGGAPVGAVLADLNGDGTLDLASANDFVRSLTLYTNNGSGVFTLSSTNALSVAPLSMTSADANGDGRVDLIVSRFTVPATLSVHTNNGNAVVFSASTNNVGASPVGVAAADLNGDGWTDAVTVNSGDNTVTVLTNNQSGRFITSSTNSVGVDPRSVVIADVNRDGRMDIVSGDFGFGTGNTLTVLTNNGSGGFVLASAVVTSPSAGAWVGAADVNQDGWVDLLSANWQKGTVSVLINNRNESFGPPATYGVGSFPVSVIATDVNGDGWVDLVSGKSGLGFGSPNTISILLNRVIFDGAFAGNGAALTNLNATDLVSGTLPAARLAGTFSNALAFINPSNTYAGAFTGNGGGLTNLNASNLTGTMSSAVMLADRSVKLTNLDFSQIVPLSGTLTNPTPAGLDSFGQSVAIVGGGKLLVGAYRDSTGASSAGSAYLYSSSGSFLMAITNPSPSSSDFFGAAVAAVGDDKMIIGADQDIGLAGAAHLFNTNGTLIVSISNPSPSLGDNFGFAVAGVGSNCVLIGASGESADASSSGRAYLYNLAGTLITTFTNPTPAAADFFGIAVGAVGTDRVLIGATFDDAGVLNAGVAHLFSTNGTRLITITNPFPDSGDQFGAALAAVGTDRLLIGAPDDDATGTDSGVAYLFNTNGMLLVTLLNPAPTTNDGFGFSVAAVGTDKVVIGSYHNDAGGIDSGAAYLFTISGDLLATIPNPAAAAGDEFGTAVAADAGRVLVGAPLNDTGAGAAGVAHLFNLGNFYLSGLQGDGVRDGTITTASIADGAVTAAKISGVLATSQIPDLDASKITTGTLADARLSSNIARLNATQTFTGTNTFGKVTIGGLFSLPPSTNAPTAGATLPATNSFVRLNPAAAVTLSGTTAISNGDTVGAVMILQGMNNVNTVTINDAANTQLGAASRVLGLDDTLLLIWNGSDWIEVSFANN